MNRKDLVLCLLATLFLLGAVAVSDVTAAWTPPAGQDVCWRTPTSEIVRIRFMNVGGGYYQLAGKVTGASNGTRAIFGSAVMATSSMYGTTTLSATNTAETWTETARIVLNRTTENLTIETMGVATVNRQMKYQPGTMDLLP